MKLWIDNVIPSPQKGKWPDNPEWLWVKDIDEAKLTIEAIEYFSALNGLDIEFIDIGQGDNYFKLLEWLEDTERDYPIRIHSTNLTDVENM